MKIEVPVTFNGYACILEDGEFCFSDDKEVCLECGSEDCTPVMVELVPANEWVDRKMTERNIHTDYQNALSGLKDQLTNLKAALDGAKNGVPDV